jgi:hypothetical protein
MKDFFKKIIELMDNDEHFCNVVALIVSIGLIVLITIISLIFN